MALPENRPASAFVALDNSGWPPPPNNLTHEEKIAGLKRLTDSLRDQFIGWAKAIDASYDPDKEMESLRHAACIPVFPVKNSTVIEALTRKSGLPKFIMHVAFFDSEGAAIEQGESTAGEGG